MLTAPNLLTLLRLMLAPFVAADILEGYYGRAIALAFFAGLTDVFDGLLARKMGESTATGAYLDPIADKILLSAIYVALGVAHAIPWWMVAVVFGRDVLILGMAAYGILFTTIRKFPPSVWGKLSTFFQISAALMVMCARAGFPAPVKLAVWLMVAATVWSGIHYAWRGIMLLRSGAG
ncbi:MAG: CDP-alcohol phosphatidyltransferase family protein [Bryobacteraceae bacterium]